MKTLIIVILALLLFLYIQAIMITSIRRNKFLKWNCSDSRAIKTSFIRLYRNYNQMKLFTSNDTFDIIEIRCFGIVIYHGYDSILVMYCGPIALFPYLCWYWVSMVKDKVYNIAMKRRDDCEYLNGVAENFINSKKKK